MSTPSRHGEIWPESEESRPWVPHAGHLIDVLAEAAIASIATGQPVDLRGGWQP